MRGDVEDYPGSTANRRQAMVRMAVHQAPQPAEYRQSVPPPDLLITTQLALPALMNTAPRLESSQHLGTNQAVSGIGCRQQGHEVIETLGKCHGVSRVISTH